nr:unnamed protein product [Callosobruchus analis]
MDKNTPKRKRCPVAWKKNARKRARLHGEQYTSESGKLMEEKATGPDCTCKKKCMSIINQTEKESI